MAHLRDDFVPQIPRQNEEIVGPGLVDSGYWINWNVHPGSILSVFLGVGSTVKSRKSAPISQ